MTRFQKCSLSLVTPEGSCEEHGTLAKVPPTFLWLPFPVCEVERRATATLAEARGQAQPQCGHCHQAAPPPLTARPHGNPGLRLPPTPSRPPSCGPEAVRAGGLWEAAVSGGAAFARDGEAAAGPQPEVSGARGQGSRRGCGSGPGGRRRSAFRTHAERAAAPARGGRAAAAGHTPGVRRIFCAGSSPACLPLPHGPVLFYFEPLGGSRWVLGVPAVLAHGLLGFVVPVVPGGSPYSVWRCGSWLSAALRGEFWEEDVGGVAGAAWARRCKAGGR